MKRFVEILRRWAVHKPRIARKAGICTIRRAPEKRARVETTSGLRKED